MGSRLPIHIGAGKALLAAHDDAEVEAILDARTDLPADFDHQRLLADVHEIRERGYSTSRGEREPGIASIAAAIPTSRGLFAAVQVTGTFEEIPEPDTPTLGRRVQQAAFAVAHEYSLQLPA